MSREIPVDERRCRYAVPCRFMQKLKKWLAWLSVFVGGLLAALGVVFAVTYLWEAIISRLGEPDQSPVFWYLPILFLGLIACAEGLKLLLRGIKQIRSMSNGDT